MVYQQVPKQSKQALCLESLVGSIDLNMPFEFAKSQTDGSWQ